MKRHMKTGIVLIFALVFCGVQAFAQRVIMLIPDGMSVAGTTQARHIRLAGPHRPATSPHSENPMCCTGTPLQRPRSRLCHNEARIGSLSISCRTLIHLLVAPRAENHGFEGDEFPANRGQLDPSRSQSEASRLQSLQALRTPSVVLLRLA